MVTLNTAYGLCSLIDHGRFVHVSDDEDGCAIITLGKNIAIRYRLVDQKQLNSWSTIPPFTAQVIYNLKEAEYIGIFNETYVKIWKSTDTNLDKVKRIKLCEAGHSILLSDSPLVLFKSGTCCRLSDLLDKSYTPNKGFLTETSKIVGAKIFLVNNEKYLVFLALHDKSKPVLYCVKLRKNDLQPDVGTLVTLKLRRRDHQLISFCFVARESGEHFVTLWSDGFMYMLALPWREDSLGQFSGLLRSVSRGTPAAMASIGGAHVAVYGGDPSEEGAVLAVYNLDFGMVQASTTFKLLHKPPRLWAVHNRLLLGFGQRLLCVPFKIETGSVSALVGSRPLASETQTSDIMAVVPLVAWKKPLTSAKKRQLESRGPTSARSNQRGKGATSSSSNAGEATTTPRTNNSGEPVFENEADPDFKPETSVQKDLKERRSSAGELSTAVPQEASMTIENENDGVSSETPASNIKKEDDHVQIITKQSVHAPNTVLREINDLAAQGLSESGICEALVTQYLEKENVAKLCWCLNNFVDIPERLTVRLLHFAFSSNANFASALPKSSDRSRSSPAAPLVNGGSPNATKKKRKSLKNGHDDVIPHVNGLCYEILEVPETPDSCPISPPERAAFVNRVLQVPNNKSALVPALRTGFSTADCINILHYLNYLLTSHTPGLEDTTIEWVATVIDAFYQQLLLGRNSECVEAVLRLRDSLQQQMNTLKELKELLPQVLRLKSKKRLTSNPLQLKSYSIQMLRLFE